MLTFVAKSAFNNQKTYLFVIRRESENEQWMASPEAKNIPDDIYVVPGRVFSHPIEGGTAGGSNAKGFIDNGRGMYFSYDSHSRVVSFIPHEEVKNFLAI